MAWGLECKTWSFTTPRKEESVFLIWILARGQIRVIQKSQIIPDKRILVILKKSKETTIELSYIPIVKIHMPNFQFAFQCLSF